MTRKTANVRVNQVGYRPIDVKHFVTDDAVGKQFEVLNDNGDIVLTGDLSQPIRDESSGETVCRGDFSALRAPGIYMIRIAGTDATSYPFKVAADVYHEATDALLKCFYFQRCGMELAPGYAGAWAHKACHTAHAAVYGEEGKMLPQRGGWHDAGDYGKYTVAAAKAIADLLLAYECYPSAFSRPIGIPETGGGIPDILHEVRYELEFLLNMQRAKDGAVFHKVSTRQFPGLAVMPEDDTAELVFSPVSVAASATFAAAMARSARVYRFVAAPFAEKCLAAAEKAWEWAAANRETGGFKNPPGIMTGEYGDQTIADEIYWASAELFRTTGQSRYLTAFHSALKEAMFPLCELGWADVAGYGTLAYLGSPQEQTDPEVRGRLLTEWLTRADEFMSNCERNGYLISLVPEQYIWGSNMVLLNQAMHLILAARFSGNMSYEEAALHHLHYLFGRNPVNLSYVTGIGTAAVQNPHHRPSIADGVREPVPGMVAGGPDRGLQDDCAKANLQGLPPAKCFIDHRDSYSTNEMAIYWNSPAVFVAACFNDVK
ncbi:MAG TPA: glycoside hydrolase family 9 protein [Bacilli bacterium]